MTSTTKRDVIEAAMSVADDTAAGRLSPADLRPRRSPSYGRWSAP